MTRPETPPKLRCPTCGARQDWSDTCRRCRCDLRLVHRALRAVNHHRRQCLEFLREDRYDQAWQAARQCCDLDDREENRQLLALVEFIRGNFPAAVRVARGPLESSPTAKSRQAESPEEIPRDSRQPLAARWPR